MIQSHPTPHENPIIDMVVSFILVSLIVTLPILTLLLIKSPLGGLW
jgi:hypothetical protein